MREASIVTAQLEAPTATATVLMTAEEARACVNRIKADLEDVRSLVFDLKEREGCQALGYSTWNDCIRAEFAMSRQRAHQLLNAYMIDRILAGGSDVNIVDGSSGSVVARIEENPPIPEAHAREIAPIIDQPEAVRSVVAKVRELKGEQATAQDVRAEVDAHLSRPAKPVKAGRTAPVRQSVSSRAEASDFADDAPDYADQSQETYGDAANAEKWCADCGGKYRGQQCPCASAPAADPFDGLTPHPDGVSAPILADSLAGEDAPASDQPGEVGPSAEADTPTDTAPAPPAASRPFDPAPRSSGVSIQKRPAAATTRTFSAPTLDAGDLTRALFDFPHAAVVEAIGEALTAQERGSLAAQMIDALPTAEVERLAHRIAVRARNGASAAPDLRVALAERAPAEIVEALADGASVTRLTALVSLLAERLTRARLQSGAVRVAV